MIRPQSDRLRVEAEIARLVDDAVEDVRDVLIDNDDVPWSTRARLVADLLALCDESYDQGGAEHDALWRGLGDAAPTREEREVAS